GAIIDSPGIREFGLWHVQRGEIEQGFREFRPLLGHCKFRDCQHEAEPGCALLAAVARGDIEPQRLESYRHIVGEQGDG
ncbi:MAG: ribosome biogenesis GTPase RsgA, partial [Halieaceae bacterium]|nr:ribosome biogenesis GTPase RsgA [Halieaceae bacterium]